MSDTPRTDAKSFGSQVMAHEMVHADFARELERDLSVRGKALARSVSLPTVCNLCALYLPWSVDRLISHIREGGAV